MNLTEILPKIIGKEFKEKIFNPKNIYDSLLKETSINSDYAKKITDNVCRFLIGSNLQLITPPLIREIVNVELLKLGLEKERLQYTRIGFPYYDLINKISKLNFKNIILNNQNKILSGVIKEFYEVKKLIETPEVKKVDKI